MGICWKSSSDPVPDQTASDASATRCSTCRRNLAVSRGAPCTVWARKAPVARATRDGCQPHVGVNGRFVKGGPVRSRFRYGSLGPYESLLQDLAPVKGRAFFAGTVSTMGQIGGLLAPVTIGFLVRATGSFTAGFLFMIGALGATPLSYVAHASYLAKDQ